MDTLLVSLLPFSLSISAFPNPNQNKSAAIIPPNPSTPTPPTPMDVDNVPPNPSTPTPPTLEITNFVHAKLSSSDPERCTLILMEGESAKQFVMSGLKSVDSDYYAVFALGGKPLNVSKKPKEVQGNFEIQTIIKILGLQQGRTYENVEGLRYGHLMLMTDQDFAGTHIKGLVINLFYTLWPSLLKINSFLQTFHTPIVKASIKNEETNDVEVKLFYTITEYEEWEGDLQNKSSDFDIKYYKGLGTMAPEEAEDIFRMMDHHIVNFVWSGIEDANVIKLCFSGKNAKDKKDWILKPLPDRIDFDSTNRSINYKDFFNYEFRMSAKDDVQRSIPSVVDGLKRCQRKVLFTMLDKKYNDFVHNISGWVATRTFYHHSKSSLDCACIHMAQDFVGSNNINLLSAESHFGTRDKGPSSHVKARYLSTFVSPITRCIFRMEDDGFLSYKREGGMSVEPKFYYPIIPMTLVNGCNTIANGFRSFIPNYNPRDLIDNLIRLLEGQEVVCMDPWYKGFYGEIKKTTNGYTTAGTVVIIKEDENDCTIAITELPVMKWTQTYKEKVLDVLRSQGGIQSYKDLSTIKSVNLEIKLSRAQLNRAKEVDLLDYFKLYSQISLANMNLLDANGELKKYATPEEILHDYFHLRLGLYKQRKRAELLELKKEALLLQNKAKFTGKVLIGDVILFPWKAETPIKLKALNFAFFNSIPNVAAKVADNYILREDEELWEEENEGEKALAAAEDEYKGDEAAMNEENKGEKEFDVTVYDYLLKNADFAKFTDEGKLEIEMQRDLKNLEFRKLANTNSKTAWKKDLHRLRVSLQENGFYG